MTEMVGASLKAPSVRIALGRNSCEDNVREYASIIEKSRSRVDKSVVIAQNDID